MQPPPTPAPTCLVATTTTTRDGAVVGNTTSIEPIGAAIGVRGAATGLVIRHAAALSVGTVKAVLAISRFAVICPTRGSYATAKQLERRAPRA